MGDILTRNLSFVRPAPSNLALGQILAFTAGAINAGGFVAAGRYSSHMTGILSSTADALVLGEMSLILAGLISIVAFVTGAMLSTLQISWARRAKLHGEHAWSLVFEALLLLLMGLFGGTLNQMDDVPIPVSVLLFCFIMGLQNAIVVKVSSAEIRTTHMTGIVTDLGIELGRLLYWNRNPQLVESAKIIADREKLKVRFRMLFCFLTGAVCGTLAFQQLEFYAAIAFALPLFTLAIRPIYLDNRRNARNSG